jgi:ESCRT-I complex subunit VPS28
MKLVAETVQHFITAMDALKLNMVAVDQLHPLMNDLVESLQRVPLPSASSPAHLEALQKLKLDHWLGIFDKMKASEELTADQLRQVHGIFLISLSHSQLLFDLESAYSAFHRLLQ